MNQYKTHNCGELRIENKGEEVRLAGWVQRIRNLGSMKFIDLRDQYGITQIVISEGNKEVYEMGKNGVPLEFSSENIVQNLPQKHQSSLVGKNLSIEIPPKL